MGQPTPLTPQDHAVTSQNQEQTIQHHQVAAEWKCPRQRIASPQKNLAPDNAPVGTALTSPCVKEDLDQGTHDLFMAPDTSPVGTVFASPYVKKDVDQSPHDLYIAPDTTLVGTAVTSPCLNKDVDRGPQDPYIATSNTHVEAEMTSACVKRDDKQDPCHDQQHVVDGVDLLCGLEGIKTEPEELNVDVRSSEPAEMECSDPGIDRELPMYVLSDMTAGLESVAAETRYNPSHFLSGSGPSSAYNSVEEGFLSHIGIDGVESALQLDFAPSSAAPLASRVNAMSTGKKGQRLHLCPQCGKSFRHESRLKIHIRIHTGEKPFVCTLCGKRFNNDGTLRNHWRVHTELRLYSCHICGKSFKDTYTCRKHQRVHNGRRAHVHRAQENVC